MTILRNPETPPPLSLDTPDFSDKDFSDWPRPPPLFGGIFREKNSVFDEKNQYFIIKPFWNR